MAESLRLTQALLDQLAAQWRRHEAPIARRLAPGLSDAEIDALAEPLGLRVPTEARTWWRWHNGAQEGFIVISGGNHAGWSARAAPKGTNSVYWARVVAGRANCGHGGRRIRGGVAGPAG